MPVLFFLQNIAESRQGKILGGDANYARTAQEVKREMAGGGCGYADGEPSQLAPSSLRTEGNHGAC